MPRAWERILQTLVDRHIHGPTRGDHKFTVASMVSRRVGRAFSNLVCGTGAHHIRTVPARSGAARAGWRPSPPHPHLLAHESQYRGFPSCTMNPCAGDCRHKGSSCRPNVMAAPGCALIQGYEGWFDGFPGPSQPRSFTAWCCAETGVLLSNRDIAHGVARWGAATWRAGAGRPHGGAAG
jgi:hypothetical protein